MNLRPVRLWVSGPMLVIGAALISGCGDGGVHDVKQWMDEVERQTPVTVQKISEPKTFRPFVYAANEELDPYNPGKLHAALTRAQASAKSGIRPDLDRRKEPLENFPLDSITMVGTLERPGLSYGLVRVDRTVFQVKVGNYIGQNFGMVTRVTDSEVQLREIIRDPTGDWTERRAKLELQETEK
jgi:type IV pilus assembly protein PilP